MDHLCERSTHFVLASRYSGRASGRLCGHERSSRDPPYPSRRPQSPREPTPPAGVRARPSISGTTHAWVHVLRELRALLGDRRSFSRTRAVRVPASARWGRASAALRQPGPVPRLRRVRDRRACRGATGSFVVFGRPAHARQNPLRDRCPPQGHPPSPGSRWRRAGSRIASAAAAWTPVERVLAMVCRAGLRGGPAQRRKPDERTKGLHRAQATGRLRDPQAEHRARQRRRAHARTGHRARSGDGPECRSASRASSKYVSRQARQVAEDLICRLLKRLLGVPVQERELWPNRRRPVSDDACDPFLVIVLAAARREVPDVSGAAPEPPVARLAPLQLPVQVVETTSDLFARFGQGLFPESSNQQANAVADLLFRHLRRPMVAAEHLFGKFHSLIRGQFLRLG